MTGMQHTGSNASRFFRWFRSVGILAAFIGLFAVSAFAQAETGRITGTVTDSSGAVVAGATITITSVDKGTVRSTVTDETGNYSAPNLLPGLYEIKIEKSGFSTATQKAQVSVGGTVTVSLSLSAGGTIDVVNVTGESGVQINVQDQQLVSVVTERQLKELPNLTRNPYGLVTLSGNVSPNDPDGRGAGFAVNGQRSASANILLDGADNNNTFTATVGQGVSLDAVGEYSIITSNFSAEYGRASGAVVNVVTKSGSNDFHGTAFAFNRLSALAANTYNNNANSVDKGVFTRNQFGYSVGGPIVKNKLFFFSSGEWTRVRSSAPSFFLTPTPQLIAASSQNTRNFFANYPVASGVATGRVYTVAQVIASAGIGAGSFSNLPGNLPAFQQSIVTAPTDAGGGSPQNNYQLVNRVDWNVNEKMQVYVRYALESSKLFDGVVSLSPYQGFNTGQTDFNNNILGSVTYTFSPRFTVQSKVVYNRLNNQQPLGSQPVGPTLFMDAAAVRRIDGNPITFPGYGPLAPGSAIPFGGPQNLFQTYHDATYTLGKHELRFGGAYIRIADNRVFGAYQNAVAVLGNTFSGSLNNLVDGNLRQFQVAIDPQGQFPGANVTLPLSQPQFGRNNRYNEWSLYVNDKYRIHPRVTVNLGLRYEYYGVQHNTNSALDSNFYFGQGANILQRIQNGRVLTVPNSPNKGLWNKDLNNFAPRVGIAWDIFGNGKTSLRGGYGVSYERNFGNVTFNVIQNPPNYGVLSILAGQQGFQTIPLSTNPLGPFGGSGPPRPVPAVTLRAVDPNIRTAYAHTWAAAIEHQLTKDIFVSIEYSGSKGVNLYSIANINRPFSNVLIGGNGTPGTGQLTGNLNPQYSNINFRGSDGSSIYHGVTFSAQTREIRNTGLTFLARYTYSHAIDNLSSSFSAGQAGNFGLGYLDPFNPNLDRGSSDFDVRGRFVTSGIWAIPFAKNLTGISKVLLDGWQTSFIFTANTGAPFSLYDCSNAFVVCSRALINPGTRLSGPGTATDLNTFNYLDFTSLTPLAGTYVNPASGTSDFGPYPANMSGRNIFTGPGFWNLDFTVAKRFKITERFGLQFRAESFNLFNHSNLFVDGSTADVSTLVFGGNPFVRSFRGGQPRNVQFGLKLIF